MLLIVHVVSIQQLHSYLPSLCLGTLFTYQVDANLHRNYIIHKNICIYIIALLISSSILPSVHTIIICANRWVSLFQNQVDRYRHAPGCRHLAGFSTSYILSYCLFLMRNAYSAVLL